jgi:hypothetical protein
MNINDHVDEFKERSVGKHVRQALIEAICHGMGDEARPWDASNVSPGWLREYVQHEIDVITDGEWFEQLVEKAVARRLEK